MPQNPSRHSVLALGVVAGNGARKLRAARFVALRHVGAAAGRVALR